MKHLADSNSNTIRDKILTDALIKAASILGLSQSDLSQVLGPSQASMTRTFAGQRPIEENSKAGEIAVMLIRSFRSLDAIVGGKEEAIRHWFKTENTYLGGVPAELVKTIQGLNNVCEYLDAMRGKI